MTQSIGPTHAVAQLVVEQLPLVADGARLLLVSPSAGGVVWLTRNEEPRPRKTSLDLNIGMRDLISALFAARGRDREELWRAAPSYERLVVIRDTTADQGRTLSLGNPDERGELHSHECPKCGRDPEPHEVPFLSEAPGYVDPTFDVAFGTDDEDDDDDDAEPDALVEFLGRVPMTFANDELDDDREVEQ